MKLNTNGLFVSAAVLVFGSIAMARAQAPAPASQSAVPVSVTTVTKRDVPIWLRGLGTVQANFAAQIRPRVDGTLSQVPVKEGQTVKQGDLLAVIDPRPYQAALDAADAKKGQDQAQLANARADLARYASLVRSDFASRQQLDTQQALVNQFNAAIVGDDAQIEAARLNLSFCYITSPFDGRVGLRNVDPGNVVHSAEATAILSVTQVQPIAVSFTLPQDTLPAIMQAMAQGQLKVAAWSGNDQAPLAEGTLLTPDNAIDTTTGTIRLKATFPNENNRLWPGQFVTAQLLLRTEYGVAAVPTRAVQHGQTGLYVYVVRPDSTVQRQEIEAQDQGQVMVVTKGLEEGQTVVLDGQSRLENGLHVSTTAATPGTAAGG